MAQKNSWSKWLLILVVLGGVVGAGIWYFKKDEAAPQYQTAPVSRGDLMQAVTATGSLTPVVNVQVGSQISGRIRALHVDFNSTVKSNQVIAEIDPSTYQVAVMRAEAQVANASANLKLARVQATRATTLFNSKLIPESEYDIATAQQLQAEAELKSAEAALASANVDLSRCSIVAPVDGVVISRNVDVGQTVAASFNTPTLFVIANDLSKMQIGALVSEADIGGVENGQGVNFTVDAYPYRTFRGKVSQIRYGAVTNQNVVNYSAVIDVDNEDLKLLPSMTANVSVIIQEREGVLKIPNAALRFRPPETAADSKTNSVARAPSPERRAEGMGRGEGRAGGQRRGRPAEGGDRFSRRTVYTIDGKDSANPTLKPVQIRTGITDGVSTEVLEGLNEGDQVVTGSISSDAGPQQGGPANPFGGGMRRRF